ncbi:MAG: HD-GYP domain-containing protein, partial [Bacilli bacterium]|nr:HD-GYP domain-containing protein [Bacilli bacterium]
KIQAEQIYLAGLIHDVGKIGIPELILRKPGKLDAEEFHTIQSHSSIGGDILHGIKEFPVFQDVARSHHERFDGSGYPDKLKGEEIPFYARIVTICDCFDAMTSDRAYRLALSDEAALQEIRRCSGSQFDPKLVEAFLTLCSSFPDSIRNHIDEMTPENTTKAPSQDS